MQVKTPQKGSPPKNRPKLTKSPIANMILKSHIGPEKEDMTNSELRGTCSSFYSRRHSQGDTVIQKIDRTEGSNSVSPSNQISIKQTNQKKIVHQPSQILSYRSTTRKTSNLRCDRTERRQSINKVDKLKQLTSLLTPNEKELQTK